MSAQTVFNLAFPVAAPFWALLILAPKWTWTRRIIGSPWMVAPSLVVYFIAVAPIIGDFASEMLQPDLAGVLALVGTEAGTALIWAHLIAFDLFIGRWMYLDSRDRGISAWLMAPVLVLTILLSPFGLTAYLLLRALFRAPAPAGHTPAPMRSAA